ncbi:4-hydroxythreonine-4-phosphate dehydrogenase PdxA [Gallalistipes aquisgranensis]|uniref:4-hydroxythreonine-4-phosphate dehydrogenase PdxA n=1 Tax=Gallalistipes aquisgranensis TaxID=2779358 RepID=UPI001CF89C9F|nr:4-hydroxythreonine-4-phosphate dehydrogenase PdxA [Gallalistipes aquisgranensis]MBE5033790.1 4-hydroxythreonine-4-phosphate dehydrogenase PdxA [Gallalistipes aquisgranensis]
MSEQKIRVGITLGDVNGVGPEVVIKALSNPLMCEMCTPVLYGPAKALSYYRKGIEGAENFAYAVVSSARETRPRRVNLVECGDPELKIEPGVSSPGAGRAAVAALRAAAADVKEGAVDVLVTAPINKENVQGDDFHHTGHTEFLAAAWGGEPLMMMCSDLLKVGLVTIHVPVSEVSAGVTGEKIVARLEQLRRSLIADFSLNEPRIAVLALNPHAGDGGLLGGEEEAVIRPAIREAARRGVLAFGPFAADGLFASGAFRRYDAVLAMYHDQGLAPFKALTPQGVNFTASLPFVRTSPDHGVAYDIAGQGTADPASMREAIYLAQDIFRSRQLYARITKNPLRRYEREKGGRDVSVSDLPQTEEAD